MPLPLRYTLGSVLARKTRSLLTVGVIALVVLATTLFMGLVSSLQRTLVSTGHERNLIVLRKGSSNDGSSALSLAAFQALRYFDGVALNDKGEPLASPEMVVQPFFWAHDGGRQNVLVRGVEKIALQVHDDVRIVEGRMFQPSRSEAIVGSGVEGRYKGAQLGEKLRFGNTVWDVVGVFESGGSSFESEVWVDVRELARDARRPMPFSGIRIRVAPGADLAALVRRIDDDPRWALEAKPELEYYADQAESARVFYFLVIGLALLAGVGAAFGAANTLYAAVQSRTAEIGTLRALGFSRSSILISFLLESVCIALAGCVVGGAAAWALGILLSWLLGGIGFAASTFTTSVIQIRVGGFDFLLALLLALAIAIVGGIFPAMRAARLRPVEALRRA